MNRVCQRNTKKLRSLGSSDVDLKKARLLAVLMHGYSEPHVYERAYREASSYHDIYIEHKNAFRREAWMILSCEASWNCDSEDYRQFLRTNYYQEHLYKQIREIEEEIRTALRARNAEGLAF